jgi:hypothetical protein
MPAPLTNKPPLSNRLQREGFHAQWGVSRDWFITVKDGIRFSGVLELMPSIDPRLELGSDTRELSCLHVLREKFPFSSINQGDQIQQTSAHGQPVWKCVRRDNNPADIVVRLWIVKVVAGKDA